jgi:cystathionine beta-lyase/cystathionine gamma-synthase
MKTTISRRAKSFSTTSRTNNRLRGAQTNAVHAGEGNKHGVGVGVATPIARTSTFTFSSTAEMKLWAEGKSKAYNCRARRRGSRGVHRLRHGGDFQRAARRAEMR